MESNLNSFIQQLFTTEPKCEKSLNLIFDNIQDLKQLYSILYQIFMTGLIFKFGVNNSVNISTITDDEFEKFKKYFLSFGVTLFCKRYHLYQLVDLDNIEQRYKDELTEQFKMVNKQFIIENYDKGLKSEDLINFTNQNSDNLEDYKNQIFFGVYFYIIYFKCN